MTIVFGRGAVTEDKRDTTTRQFLGKSESPAGQLHRDSVEGFVTHILAILQLGIVRFKHPKALGDICSWEFC